MIPSSIGEGNGTKARFLPRTFATLLLSATMTACVSGCFHKKPVAAVTPLPPPPELSQTPLYSPEMNEHSPRLPSLPPESQTATVQPPPPLPKPHHVKKPKVALKPASSATETAQSSSGTPAPPSTAGTTASDTGTSTAATSSRKTTQQTSIAGAVPAAPSPIGQLTAGSSADTAATSHQTEDLIKNTREGLEGIKRSLSADEKKTVAEIWTFLNRAEQDLKANDADGALGLATKAKLLLDELTQN